MTDLATHDPERERVVDRARELTNIGAGHAAGALAGLIGRPCEMRVPRVRLLSADRIDAPFASDLGGRESDWSGVLFEVEGGFGGVLAVLFPPSARERLLATLLGPRARVKAQAESALREVGNILASHAVSALGDALGVTVMPSIPILAMHDAPAALARLVAPRDSERPALRIEVEICDRARELRALLAYVPDQPGVERAK